MFGSSIKTYAQLKNRINFKDNSNLSYRLMCGVMFVTGFLSMWINNTATTAMMIPIVDSILTEISLVFELNLFNF